MKKLDYFQYHGSSIWNKKREILENAVFYDDDTLDVLNFGKFFEFGLAKGQIGLK